MRWRWPWSRREKLPEIPRGGPYPPQEPTIYRPIERHKPESGIEVEEHDVSSIDDEDLEALRAAQSQTGIHRAWRRLTGRDD